MSSMFFHQDFPSTYRLRLSFTNDTPDLYLAEYLGVLWLDTALVPEESPFGHAVHAAHLNALESCLERHGVSLDEAYKSPTAKQSGFTYCVQFARNIQHRKGVVSIQVGLGADGQIIRLGEITSFEHTDFAVAQAEMFLWQAANGEPAV